MDYFDDSVFDGVAGITKGHGSPIFPTIGGKRYTESDLAELEADAVKLALDEEIAEVVRLRAWLTQEHNAGRMTQKEMQKGIGILYARRVAANKKLRELVKTKPV